jgi:probable phosphoglycerate mutase
MVRHGQTPSNVLHRLDTAAPGPGLTALGERQAEALPGVLAGERPDAVWTSTLVRTQLTAAPLARALGLPVQVRDGLREVEAGDLEMRDDEDAQRLYLSTVFAWAAGDTALAMPGGPTGEEVLGRLDGVVAEAAEALGARAADGGPGTAVLVSHGAAVRLWVAARASNVDVPFAEAHALANTGVVVVVGNAADGWTVESWAGSPVTGLGGSEPEPGSESGPAAEPLPEGSAAR